jgi:hypothetical protein
MCAGLLGRTVRQDLGPLMWRPGALGIAMGGGGGLFSYQSADFVHEKERCGDEQCQSGIRDRL